MNKEIELPQIEIETLAEDLSDTFLVRRDLYARQLEDGSYVCIQKFLTPEHVIAHLRGNLDSYIQVVGKGADTFIFKDFQNEFGRVEVRGRQLVILVKLAQQPDNRLEE